MEHRSYIYEMSRHEADMIQDSRFPSKARFAREVRRARFAKGSNLQERKRGFTLVELLVAGGVFAMILLAASGVFTLVLRAQRQTLLDIRVVDSTRAAMESMTRTLRTVSERDVLAPPLDTNGPVSTISFLHSGKTGSLGCPSIPPCEVVYHENNGTLYETNREPGTAGGLTFPLTAALVEVEEFQVVLRGRGDCDSPRQQPRATIVLRVRDRAATTAAIPLATTVSFRPPELCPT